MTPRHPCLLHSPRLVRVVTQVTPLLLLALMVCGLTTGVRVSTAAGQSPDDVEVQVSKAYGFTYGELKPVRPIVMFPISAKTAGTGNTSHLPSSWASAADPSRFVAPLQVEKLISTSYLTTAYDSLVTTLSMMQPASSLRLLSKVANKFSARHALVPVDVAIDNSEAHYALDVMFVLVDLESGRPRLIMSAGQALDGEEATKNAPQAEVAAQTFRAILTALRKRS